MGVLDFEWNKSGRHERGLIIVFGGGGLLQWINSFHEIIIEK